MSLKIHHVCLGSRTAQRKERPVGHREAGQVVGGAAQPTAPRTILLLEVGSPAFAAHPVAGEAASRAPRSRMECADDEDVGAHLAQGLLGGLGVEAGIEGGLPQ